MIVVAFYTTGGPYEDDALLLRRSLDRVGMAHSIEGIPDRGGWHLNTAEKASFLMRQRETLTGPLLYVDADAFVHENCAEYFSGLDADFGAHFFAGPSKGYAKADVCGCLAGEECTKEHRLLAGTLFLGDTDGCRELVERWARFNALRQLAGRRDGGGQKNLWKVWQAMEGLNTARLPGRYCYVWDKPWAYPKGEPRVIEHTIASRENRPTDQMRAPYWRREDSLRQRHVRKLWEMVA